MTKKKNSSEVAIPSVPIAIEDIFAQIVETEKYQPKISREERLVWLFKTISKEGERWQDIENALVIPLNKLQVAPYFYETIEQDLMVLVESIKNDKDFYRRNNMQNYEPRIDFDNSYFYSNQHIAVFFDFTDDFLKKYSQDRLGIKINVRNNSNDRTVEKIEVLEEKNEMKRITIYINNNYDNPMEFSRNKSWNAIYKLAKEGQIDFDKGLYDYFNHNSLNPLYAKKYCFKITKILKESSNLIVPNIDIRLITQKKIARQLKSA